MSVYFSYIILMHYYTQTATKRQEGLWPVLKKNILKSKLKHLKSFVAPFELFPMKISSDIENEKIV